MKDKSHDGSLPAPVRPVADEPRLRGTQRQADSRPTWLILLIIVVVAIGCRVYDIGGASYWLDEFDSMECSTGRGLAHVALPANRWITHPPALTTLSGAPPWPDIWTSMNLDNHPPLYFIFLRWWRDAFGNQEATTRLLSAIFSIAAVLIFYATLRPQMALAGCLWATALMALAGSQIHFAQETRGYALWAMLAMIAALSVVRIEQRGVSARWLVILGLAVLLMLLTHYFAIATVASLFIYSLIFFRAKVRRLTSASIFLACLIYAGIWGPFAWRQRLSVNANNVWQYDPAIHHLLLTLERFCLLPVKWMSESLTQILRQPGAIGVAAIVLIGLLYICWRLRRNRAMWFWLIFMLPLITLTACLDLSRHARYLTVARYTFVAGPGVFAIVGLCADSFRSRWMHVIPAIGVALCLWSLPRVYSTDQSWRELAFVLQQQVHPGDRIIYDSAGRENWWAGAMYLGVSYYAPHLSAEILLLTNPDSSSLRSGLSVGHSTWIISARPGGAISPLFSNAKVIDHANIPDIGAVWRLEP